MSGIVAVEAHERPVLARAERSGVDPELIVNHIRTNGSAQQLTANDLITLQNEGVDKAIIGALQTSFRQPVQAVAAPVPGGVVVEEHFYGPPPRRIYYAPPPPPPVSFGFSYSKRR